MSVSHRNDIRRKAGWNIIPINFFPRVNSAINPRYRRVNKPWAKSENDLKYTGPLYTKKYIKVYKKNRTTVQLSL